MQTRKRCVHCNTLNDPGRTYCVQCGKYLNMKAAPSGVKTTVWGQASVGSAVKPQVSEPPAAAPAEYIAVCPQCKAECRTEKDRLPVMCGTCGYFFQDGIDRVILKSAAVQVKEPVSVQPKTTPAAPVQQRSGPMPSTADNSSKLRLIAVSSENLMPQIVRESGEYFGSGGTLFKNLRTDIKLFVWHSRAGWYIRAEKGHPVYNGVAMNLGVSKKLNDGDTLYIANTEFRVEIF